MPGEFVGSLGVLSGAFGLGSGTTVAGAAAAPAPPSAVVSGVGVTVAGGVATRVGCVPLSAVGAVACVLLICHAAIPPPATTTRAIIARSPAFDLATGAGGVATVLARAVAGADDATTVLSLFPVTCLAATVRALPVLNTGVSDGLVAGARPFRTSAESMTTVAPLGRVIALGTNAGSFIAWTKSCTLAKRSSPFLESARATASETCCGTSAMSSCSSGASNMQCLCRMSIAESPSNGKWPASIR